MRIKKVTSLLGVLLVLSAGLISVRAAEQMTSPETEEVPANTVEVIQSSGKAKYQPISDVRHVVPPYDSQDKENTKKLEEIKLDSSNTQNVNTIVMENESTADSTVIEKKEDLETAPKAELAENEESAATEETNVLPVSNNQVEEGTAKASDEALATEEKTTGNDAITEESGQSVIETTENPSIQQEEAQPVEEVKKTESGYEAIKNKLWCITFQLVWNTFMDKVTHGPVLLAGGNPPIANELNKKLYTANLLNDNSYYITYGKINKSLKKQIERAIEKKFNETSDILDTINWDVRNSYLFYAMLKKDFNFEVPFDKLAAAPFGESAESVKYFGVNKDSDRKLRKNVHVLFYNSPDEYAVKLVTKEKEDVILFRTDKNDSFENLYLYVTQQDVSERFAKEDSLMVPNFKIDKTISYDELCGKIIKGTNNKVITQALQTIKFNMDNKGGTLKSEAALAVMRMSLNPDIGRKYHFDKEFVLFLKEQGKDKPYFAVRVENPEFLVKE